MEEKEFNYINVIPLVDIMLVLLTIVLVTATFIVQGSIPVKLPSAKYAESENIRSFQITINKDGEIFFENKKIGLEELESVIKSIDRDSQISIFADKSAKVQSLISVLDILKKYDFKKATIKTELIR
ncbi:Biopolymer transport protein ExbD/TolR [Thermodesulfobacterium geofontis OPF15]|uniref:Biopolymer transport protein ExbD/TolR n=1 Tax=Thermodesulfobacterium geofontis (strain OPF15) TaxID=795359 RepID=F8C4H6_THEGP|nr:biopolymer transporter ExbD [Thermodesulfobacterium geofontis]AEH22950.1 Biopolymer transport protein ExbD/TolR [Thermodesulfobacterium geofontis OPF15]